MYERALTFPEYVAFYGLSRSEGLVLRYLADACKALRQTVPDEANTEQLTDLIEWLGEAVYFLAQYRVTTVLGSGNDPFQPSVIPFNIGAITCGYLAAVALVRPGRSRPARAAVRVGADDAYGIYLSHMLVITALIWLGWGKLGTVVPWPLLCAATVGIVFACCLALTGLLARTPLAVPLTGRTRVPWTPWPRPRRPAPAAPVPYQPELAAVAAFGYEKNGT
jgi:hypothetical protein